MLYCNLPLEVCIVPLQVSQTIPRSQQRSQIAIPAQGMIEFRDALTDLLDEFGTDDHGRCFCVLLGFIHFYLYEDFVFIMHVASKKSLIGAISGIDPGSQ